MNRYLESFLITSFVYLAIGFAFIYTINDIRIEPKKEEIITKISLNNVSITKPIPEQAVTEPTPPEPVVEKTPEPIIKKVVEKPQPKKIEKKVEKPKPIKKPIEKPVKKIVKKEPPKEMKPVEKVVKTTETIVENTNPTPSVSKPTPSVNNTPSVPQISAQQKASIEDAYLARIKAKIEKNKVYPRSAKRLKQTGKVIISFDILKNGTIKNVKIVEKSKFAKLDEASIELLLKIASFEAIPLELNKTVWNISVPINYSIN